MCFWYSAVGCNGQRNAKWPAREGVSAEAELFTIHLNAGGDSQSREAFPYLRWEKNCYFT